MNRPPFKLNPINSIMPFDPQRGAAELQAMSEPESYVQHVIMSTSKADMATIVQLTKRMVALIESYGGVQLARDKGVIVASSMQLGLDVAMVHSRTPLELNQLLLTSDDDFTHDMTGIARNVDRLTGHLREGFTPRYLKRSPESAPKG